MRYHNITKDDMLNGDGLRVVLWVSGCTHACPECHNPVTWDINGGLPFDEAAKKELFAELAKPYVSGVTLSGGDPLIPQNVDDVSALIDEIKEKFPQKTSWVYTGYEWKDVKDLPLMKNVDVLVDGPFVKALKDTKLYWRGSSNQRVIEAKRSIEEGGIVLHCD